MLTEDSTIKDLDDAFQDADTYYQVNFFSSICWSCCEIFFIWPIQEPRAESCNY